MTRNVFGRLRFGIGAGLVLCALVGFSPAQAQTDPDSVSLDLSDTTPAFGQAITFSGTVAVSPASAPTPTGSVQVEFTDGTALCPTPAALDGNGDYSCTATFPEAASGLLVRAAYGGDGTYSAATSATRTVTVTAAATETTIVTRPASATPALVPFDVAVEVETTGDGAGLPTGTVEVAWGSRTCAITLADGSPAGDGIAEGSCTITPSALGTAAIGASYTPADGNFESSEDPGSNHTVEPAEITPAIVSVTSGARVGDTVTVQYSLTSSGNVLPDGGAGVDAITVSWGGDGCDGTVSGTASPFTGSCTFTPSEAGTQTLSLRFNEDPLNVTATGADNPVTRPLTVDPALVDFSIEKCIAAPGNETCPATPRTSLNPNEDFVYLLTVRRPSGAAGIGPLRIAVSDVLPGGIEASDDCTSAGPPCWEVCTTDSGSEDSELVPSTCPTDVLAGAGSVSAEVELSAGSSTVVVVSARVESLELGPVANTASLALVDGDISGDDTDDVTDANAANDSATVSVPIDRSTDLVVTKSDDATSAVPGTRHEYEITIANDGFLTADGVSLFDALPPEFAAGTGQWTCSARGGACCLADGASGGSCGDTEPVGPFDEADNTLERDVDLPSGSSITIAFGGDLRPDATGTLANTFIAELPAGLAESSPDDPCVTDGDDRDEECGRDEDTQLVPQGRLVLDHSVTDRSELPNDVFLGSYRIELVNEGPSDATGVVLSVAGFDQDPFVSGGLAVTSCTLSPVGAGSCISTGPAASAFTATVDVDAGATITVDLAAEIDGTLAAGPIETIAEVDWGGNTSSETRDPATLQLVRNAAITVSVDDGLSGSSGAVPGRPLTYVVDIANEGPDDAIGAAVRNIFPPELDDVSWQCVARTPVPGDLTFLDAYSDPNDLPGVPDLVVSPDGAHVYALGNGTELGAVVTYARIRFRGADFGKLTPIGEQRDGESSDGSVANTVSGMSDPVFATMAPDGRHLYVLSPADTAIVLFTRDRSPASADFGQLSYGTTVIDAARLGGVTELLVAPDGEHLYALDPGAGTVLVFERDTGSGNVAFQSEFPTTAGAAAIGGLQSSADGRFLIAVTAGGRQVFEREIDDGQSDFGDLTPLGGTGASGIASAALAPDGRHLYFQLGSGALRVENFSATTGQLTSERGAAVTVSAVGSIAVSRDGEHVYVAQGPTDALLAFRRSPSTGGLNDDDGQSVTNGTGDPTINNLENPGRVRVTADGRHVIIAGRAVASVVVLERRAPDPLFEQFEVETDSRNTPANTGGPVAGLGGATALAVQDDFVYVLGLLDSSIAVFRRDPGAGLAPATRGAHLDFLQAFEDQVLLDPVDLVVTDEWVYVAAQDPRASTVNAIRVFARDPSTGLLTFDAGRSVLDGQSFAVPGGGTLDARLNGVSGVAVSPDGNQLYAVAEFDGALNVFDIADGNLTLTQRLSNAQPDVRGLAGAIDVLVTADGEHVLTTASVSNAVGIFRRQSSMTEDGFGQLTQALDQPTLTVTGAFRIAGSPDDRHFYVTAPSRDRLYAIQRDASTSSLTFGRLAGIATYENGIDGVDGLDGARGVAVDPQGTRVFVAASASDAAVVFSRNTDDASAAFGTLVQIAVQRDGIEGVSGLDGARGVAVAGGGQAYFAALDSGALTAFQLGIGSSCTANGSGAIDDIVTVARNGAVTYTATGLLRSDALGGATRCVMPGRVLPAPDPDALCNVAEVELDGVIEPIPPGICPESGPSAEGCGIDNDTALSPEADLVITKDNAQVSVVPGEVVTYTVEIVNDGPSDAAHSPSQTVLFSDLLDPALFDVASASWTCEAVGSGNLEFLQSLGVDAGGNALALSGVTAVAALDLPLGDTLPDLLLSASALDDSVAAFGLAPDGRLAFLGALDATAEPALEGARDLVVASRSGRHFVYVASQTADSIVVLEVVDGGGGAPALTVAQVLDVMNVPGLDQPVALLLDDPGDRLYSASANGDAVHAFTIDPASGQLTPIADGGGFVGRVDGVTGASSLAFDRVGGRLYVGSRESSLLYVLDVDPATGALALAASLDAVALEISPQGLSDLAVTGDGAWLYAAVTPLDAVAAFAIRADGTLDLLEVLDTGSPSGGSLLAPTDLLLSPDERNLYVSAADSDTLFVFGRDQSTGELVINGSASERNGSAEAMDRPVGLAFGPGGQLYVAAAGSERLVAFDRVVDSSCPSSDTGAPIDVAFAASSGGRVVFEVAVPVAAGIDSGATSVRNDARIEVSIDPDTGGTASDEDVISRVADLAISKSDGIAEIDGLAGVADLLTVRTGTLENVYSAAIGESAVGVFTRNTNTGSPVFGDLRFESVVKNQVDGVSGLSGVRRLVASPEGAFLYAVGRNDNAVVVLERDLADGGLTVAQAAVDGAGGVSGMSGPADAFVSPDGAQLYVAAEAGNAIVVFDRDELTGNVAYRQTLLDGAGGTNGLVAPVAVAGSPDGLNVYAVSPSTSSVLVFARNPITASSEFGRLTFVARYQDNAGGFDGLAGARDIVLSDDGAFAYVLGADEASLAVLARDGMTGELSFVERKADGTGGVTGLAGAERLAFGPSGETLFVANPAEDLVTRFDVAGDGTLDFAQAVSEVAGPAKLAGARALAFADDGSELYVGAGQDSTLSVFTLGANEAIGEQTEVLVDGRGGVAPGDTVVYEIDVTNLGPTDATDVRVRDIFPAAFDDVRWFCTTEGGAGCIVCPPEPEYCSGNIDETNVFLPAGTRVTFTAFGSVRPGLTGSLENTATVTAAAGFTDPDLTNNTARDDDTVLSPLAGLSATLTAFEPTLTPGGRSNWSLTVENAGPSSAPESEVRLTVPEALSNLRWGCVAFPTPGRLVDTGFRVSGSGSDTTGLAVAPSGRTLYATGGDEVRVFERNAATGELAAVQTVRDGVGGVDGIAGASDVVLSPDGTLAWVAGALDDAVAIFTVDDTSGALTYVGRVVDNINGVTGLGGVGALAVSPDGSHLYAAGTADDSIAAFAVGAGGALAFVGRIGQDSAGVDGLAGVSDLLVSPDGRHVYAAGRDNDGIAVLERSAGSGALSFVEAQLGLGTLLGLLSAPSSLVMDSAGDWLVVAATASDALVVFARDGDTGALLPETAVDAGDQPALLAPVAVRFAPNDRLLHTQVADGIVTFGFTAGFLERVQALPASAVPGLAGSDELAVSPDGGFVHAGGADVLTLEVANGSFCGREGRGSLLDQADIAPGGSVVYSIVADVVESARGQVELRGAVASGPDVDDSDPADDQDVLRQPLEADLDLGVSKTDGRTRAVAGTTLDYALTVSNAGISDALDVAVTDLVPAVDPDGAGLLVAESAWTCSDQAPFTFTGTASVAELDGVRAVATASEDRWLLAAVGDELVLLERRPGGFVVVSVLRDGDPSGTGTVDGLAGASGVTVTEASTDVYVTGTDSVTHFRFDSDTGALEWQATVRNTTATPGLRGARAPTLSPDGRQLYVLGEASDAVAILARNRTTGALTYFDRVRDGFGDLSQIGIIDGPVAMAVRSDGRFAYVASAGIASLAVFERDPVTGDLALVEVHRDGDPIGETTLALIEPGALALTSSGASLYLSDRSSPEMRVFDVDTQTGATVAVAYAATATAGGLDTFAITNDTSFLAPVSGSTLAFLRRELATGALVSLGAVSGPASAADPIGVLVAGDRSRVEVLATDGALALFDAQPYVRCEGDAGTEALVELVDLSPGAVAALEYTGLTIDPASRGTVRNELQVVAPSGAGPVTASGIDETVVDVETDLAVTVVPPEDALVAGRRYAYRILVSNAGPSSALGATLGALLDPAFVDLAWTCTSSTPDACPASGEGEPGFAFSLPPDGSLEVDVLARLASGAPPSVSIGARVEPEPATAPGASNDPAPGDNEAVVTLDVSYRSDAAISIMPVGDFLAGAVGTFDVLVRNAGPSDAGVRVRLEAPGGQAIAEWRCPDPACAAASGTGPLDVVVDPLGGRRTVTLSADVAIPPDESAGTTIGVVGTVAVLPDSLDRAPEDNEASASATVATLADLAVVKTAAVPTTDTAGDTRPAPFVIEVRNAGPSDALEVVLTDDFGATLETLESFDCAPIGAAPGVLDCNLRTLPAGATATVNLLFQAREGIAPVTNRAIVTAGTPDPVLADNTSDATLPVAPGFDGYVTIQEAPAKGDERELVLEVRFANGGTLAGSDVEVNLAQPEGTEAMRWTCRAEAPDACSAADGEGALIAHPVVLGSAGAVVFELTLALPEGVAVATLPPVTVTARVDGEGDIFGGNDETTFRKFFGDLIFADGFGDPIRRREEGR